MAFPGSPIYARLGEVGPFARPERAVDTVFVHCSASDRPGHDDISVIRSWHVAPRSDGGRGWSDVGYHFFINKDGTIQPGRPLERIPAAQKDFNRGSIAICLHGLERARFTTEQALSLVALCDSIHSAYAAIRTELRFRGHCEVASKTCPVFDYATVLGLNLAGRVVAAPQPARIAEPPAQAASADVIADPDQLDLMDRGVPVRRLQTALNRHGARLRVDGIFGQLTREAVIAFQRDRGLAADGIAGPETRAALGLQ